MTMQEAATLAADASPKELWLTHYSPSLIRPDLYLNELKEIFPNVIAARDGQNTTLLFDEE
jgi:ribonuclease Z